MTAEELPRVTEETAERLTAFIRDYVSGSGAEGAVIGLSGGLDSAVVTKLAVDALGAENVLTMYLPSDRSPRDDLRCTEELSRLWGTELEVVNIQPAIDAFISLLDTDLSPMDQGNASSRCRMAMLYARARTMNRMVIGTSNKSELMMGYFTKHGDGACDLLPLADLYKTDVRRLAELLNVPEEVISKPPSAGFWEGQTDEEEMGFSYDVLDRILSGIENGESDASASDRTGVPAERIASIRNRVASTAHKRTVAARPDVAL